MKTKTGLLTVFKDVKTSILVEDERGEPSYHNPVYFIYGIWIMEMHPTYGTSVYCSALDAPADLFRACTRMEVPAALISTELLHRAINRVVMHYVGCNVKPVIFNKN